jgi:hypothetical protein
MKRTFYIIPNTSRKRQYNIAMIKLALCKALVFIGLKKLAGRLAKSAFNTLLKLSITTLKEDHIIARGKK